MTRPSEFYHELVTAYGAFQLHAIGVTRDHRPKTAEDVALCATCAPVHGVLSGVAKAEIFPEQHRLACPEGRDLLERWWYVVQMAGDTARQARSATA